MMDVGKSALGQVGIFGFDQSDMIEPYRATDAMMRQGITDASLAGLPSIPGEVSIAAISPDKPMTNLGTNESFNEAASSGTVTDGNGNPVTNTGPDGTVSVVTTGTPIQQAAAKQSFAAGNTKTPAGSPAAVQAVLDSLDPSKAISSDVTTSISDIVSGTGMTPASTGSSSSSSKPSTPAPSSPANPANYNNKDGVPSKPSSPPPGHPEYNQGGNDDSSSGGK